MLKKICKFFEWLFYHGIEVGDIYISNRHNPFENQEFYKILDVKKSYDDCYWVKYVKCHNENGTGCLPDDIGSLPVSNFTSCYQFYKKGKKHEP